EKLNQDINAILTDPQIEARIGELGGAPFAVSAAELAKFLADDSRPLRSAVEGGLGEEVA
ncbi:MAG TPA: hypothetical protein VF760_00990, partial [Xanthobacteraceae bacterium]